MAQTRHPDRMDVGELCEETYGVQKQQALLSYVLGLIPPKTAVFLVGDSEFEIVELMRLFESWGWKYTLRQRASTQVWVHGEWRAFGSLLTKVGQSL